MSEKMTTSEPTTEIVEEITSQSTTRDIIVVLKMIVQYLESFTMDKMSRDVMSAAADRLERQERELSEKTEQLEYTNRQYDLAVADVEKLTARAESAERERDAAVNALALYEDALLDECDRSYQSGFMDGFRSREEMDDED